MAAQSTVFSFEATGANGETLDALARIIEKRSTVMWESSRDATIATIITALKSLRKLTRNHKGGIKVDIDLQEKLSVELTECPDYYVAFDTQLRKWKIRGRGNTIVPGAQRPWWQVKPEYKFMKEAKVFKIRLSSDRLEAWSFQKKESFMVARSTEEAKKIVEKRFGKIVKTYSKLAGSTIGKAMMLVSSKPVSIKLTDKATKIMNANLYVDKQLDATGQMNDRGTFGIEVHDKIRFATDALEGGAGAVNIALMRAANSVNGMLNKAIERDTSGFFSERGITVSERPFPESMFEPESQNPS